jgi:hypothetical protein
MPKLTFIHFDFFIRAKAGIQALRPRRTERMALGPRFRGDGGKDAGTTLFVRDVYVPQRFHGPDELERFYLAGCGSKKQRRRMDIASARCLSTK